MGLVGTAIGMLVALILSVGAFEFGQEAINFKNQEELIGQLQTIQHAMTSYGRSICGINLGGVEAPFNCTAPSWNNFISSGYLPAGFNGNFSSLVLSANIALNRSSGGQGQELKLSLPLPATSLSVCQAAAVAITETSCSTADTTIYMYAPIITGSVWDLVNSGQFVYP